MLRYEFTIHGKSQSVVVSDTDAGLLQKVGLDPQAYAEAMGRDETSGIRSYLSNHGYLYNPEAIKPEDRITPKDQRFGGF